MGTFDWGMSAPAPDDSGQVNNADVSALLVDQIAAYVKSPAFQGILETRYAPQLAGTSEWVTLVLSSGVSPDTTGVLRKYPPAVRKDADGTVFFRGAVSYSGAAGSAEIARIPEGYYPPWGGYYAVYGERYGTIPDPDGPWSYDAPFQLLTNGVGSLYAINTGASFWVSLNGLSYKVD